MKFIKFLIVYQKPVNFLILTTPASQPQYVKEDHINVKIIIGNITIKMIRPETQ